MPDYVPSEFGEFRKWADQAIEEAEAFLKTQHGYDNFDDTIQAIMGEYVGNESRPSTLMKTVTYNYLGKVALEGVAGQVDLKPFWNYGTKNSRFAPQADLGNKLAEAWWLSRNVSLRFADVVKFAYPMGTGYAHQVYNPQSSSFTGGYQGGDIEMLPEDPRDVLPIRPGSFLSIQECSGVMIRRERSVNWIRSKYGTAAAGVRPDRDASIAQMNRATRVSRFLATMGFRSGFMENLYGSIQGKPKAAPLNIPSADLFNLYIEDPSINTSGVEKWMGLNPETGNQTNWSYRVPYVGQLKPGGGVYKDDDPEVRLFPRKRNVIFTRSAKIYDDTSIYWHGMFPVSKLTLDPWPWSWLGKAPLKDVMPLHAELQKVMRIFSQHANRIRRPGITADKNAISAASMSRLDPEREGLKIRTNPVAGGKPIEMLYEPAMDQFMERYFTLLKTGHDELGGNNSTAQLMAELNQIPQMETVDKLSLLQGLVSRLRSLVIEAFMSEFAIMLLMNFFQFYTTAQRVAVLGVQGLTFEDFDFDPGTLIPDMLDMSDSMGRPMRDPSGQPLPRYERAREFYRYFTYQIAPGSLLNSASIQEKMLYLQLARTGVIDIATLLEKLNIPNLGLPESFPSGILQRLQWQQQNQIGMAVNSAGRKASGESAPRLKMSESG